VLTAMPVVLTIDVNKTLSPFLKPCAANVTKSPASVNVTAAVIGASVLVTKSAMFFNDLAEFKKFDSCLQSELTRLNCSSKLKFITLDPPDGVDAATLKSVNSALDTAISKKPLTYVFNPTWLCF